jgi:hypothetical protein
VDPVRGLFKLLVKIGGAVENQVNDHLGGGEQRAVGEAVKNTAKQAKEKPPAIRPDEAPELAQEINHYVLIYARDATAGENFLSGLAAHFWVAGLTLWLPWETCARWPSATIFLDP